MLYIEGAAGDVVDMYKVVVGSVEIGMVELEDSAVDELVNEVNHFEAIVTSEWFEGRLRNGPRGANVCEAETVAFVHLPFVEIKEMAVPALAPEVVEAEATIQGLSDM